MCVNVPRFKRVILLSYRNLETFSSEIFPKIYSVEISTIGFLQPSTQ